MPGHLRRRWTRLARRPRKGGGAARGPGPGSRLRQQRAVQTAGQQAAATVPLQPGRGQEGGRCGALSRTPTGNKSPAPSCPAWPDHMALAGSPFQYQPAKAAGSCRQMRQAWAPWAWSQAGGGGRARSPSLRAPPPPRARAAQQVLRNVPRPGHGSLLAGVAREGASPACQQLKARWCGATAQPGKSQQGLERPRQMARPPHPTMPGARADGRLRPQKAKVASPPCPPEDQALQLSRDPGLVGGPLLAAGRAGGSERSPQVLRSTSAWTTTEPGAGEAEPSPQAAPSFSLRVETPREHQATLPRGGVATGAPPSKQRRGHPSPPPAHQGAMGPSRCALPGRHTPGPEAQLGASLRPQTHAGHCPSSLGPTDLAGPPGAPGVAPTGVSRALPGCRRGTWRQSEAAPAPAAPRQPDKHPAHREASRACPPPPVQMRPGLWGLSNLPKVTGARQEQSPAPDFATQDDPRVSSLQGQDGVPDGRLLPHSDGPLTASPRGLGHARRSLASAASLAALQVGLLASRPHSPGSPPGGLRAPRKAWQEATPALHGNPACVPLTLLWPPDSHLHDAGPAAGSPAGPGAADQGGPSCAAGPVADRAGAAELGQAARQEGPGGNSSEPLQKGLVKGLPPVTRYEQTALRAGSEVARGGDRGLLRRGRKRDCGDPRDGAQRLPAPG
ncbi:collagen alpha-1(I) chain-like [Muntiacus reevesi]|uniref:collagen alpha-1(I) chain-like n=1 Tax=Muntiacus reevesi TaxID=9886 RepID=UPI003307B28E